MERDAHSDVEWNALIEELPRNWRSLARESGLIPKRTAPGAKVTDIHGFEAVLRLVFYHVATNASLRVATAMGAAAGIITLSPVALHLWMRKMGSYIETLLAAVTMRGTGFAPQRWSGYHVRLVDATTVQRPGACQTTARIHCAFELMTLRPVELVVTDDHVGETLKHFTWGANELVIGDRLYANPPGVAWIDGQGAHVLVRYNRGSLPLYDARGNRLDIFDKFKQLSKREHVREWHGYVHPKGGNPIRGRLCMVRLARDKAKESCERLRKEYASKGRTVTPKALQAAEFVVVFTTVPKDRLDKVQLMELYRLRWQIELGFKRDKSIMGIDQLPNFRSDTIHTWLCTKLLLGQIAQRIAKTPALSANSRYPKLVTRRCQTPTTFRASQAPVARRELRPQRHHCTESVANASFENHGA